MSFRSKSRSAYIFCIALFPLLIFEYNLVSAEYSETATSNPHVMIQSSVAGGRSHMCALIAGGGVKCWGDNTYGQLGTGSTTGSVTPVTVSGLESGVTAISAGLFHTCALLESKSVKCWGRNNLGQAGSFSSGLPVTAPRDVTDLPATVVSLTTGDSGGCAVLETGGIKCWGTNPGDGTNNSYPFAVNVTGLSQGVVAVSSGMGFTCALLDSGAVRCWGQNEKGQLGNGTNTDQVSSTAVVGLSGGVIAITTGNFHACALQNNNVLKCWGRNNSGELGNGSPNTNGEWTAVDALIAPSGTISITAGASYTCILTSAGAVKCWGNNDVGQLGSTTASSNAYTSAIDVTGLSSGVRAVSAAERSTCAVLSSGSLRCWGRNESGQLGDGSNLDRVTPVEIAGLLIGVGNSTTTTPTVTTPTTTPTVTTPTTTPTVTTSTSSPGSQGLSQVLSSTTSTLAPTTTRGTAPSGNRVSVSARRGSLVSPIFLLKKIQTRVIPGSRTTVAVNNSDKGVCNGLYNIVAKRSGICRISITQTPKNGRPVTTRVVLRLVVK